MLNPAALPLPRSNPGRPDRFRWTSWLLLALLACTGAQYAAATTRIVRVNAPAIAVPGSTVSASVFASTDATDGESILFLHVESSVDNGQTWTGIYYDTDVGKSATRIARFKVGPVGSKALVRVRVAFRGGKNGDVDCNGAPIDWAGTWARWEGPGVKSSRTLVMDQ